MHKYDLAPTHKNHTV